MTNPNIKDHGFSVNPENINKNGAPKKQINHLAEMVQRDFGLKLTKGDKFQIIESLLEKSQEELELVKEDKTSPVFMVSIAEAILGDIKAKRINTVESIFDRVFGKPKQSTELTGKDGKDLGLKIELTSE